MGERALAFLQGGFEATKGTGVAATRKLQARITNPAFNIPREFVEEDLGTLVASRRFIEGVKDYGFTIETDGATYEDLPWFLHTVVHGTPTTTNINSTAYQHVFTPQTTAAGDTLKAATIEFGDDTQEFECEYCEGNTLTLGFDTITVGQAAPLRMSIGYYTQSLASNTKTTLTDNDVETINAVQNASIRLGNDSTAYASLSALTGSLRALSINWDNRLGRKVYVGDGPTYSNIGRGRRVITFTAQVEGDANGVSRFVDWDLGTYKRLRLDIQGPAVTGSTPSRTRLFRLDGRFVLTEFDPTGEVDTNTVFNIAGRFMPDTALSDAEVQLTVINGVASYT